MFIVCSCITYDIGYLSESVGISIYGASYLIKSYVGR